MKAVNIRRAERVTSRLIDHRVRQAACGVEMLESRRLLTATVVSQIPTATVSGGQASAGITLSTYLKDPSITGGTVIEMQTPLGNIPLQLTNTQTPNTVANFVQYITNGEYTPTIIQRSAPGFVLQGGGTKPDGSNNAPVASLNSEAGISNTTGTIAMALSSGPNSGTNQWFINLADNASLLDGSNDGGPFTVFGNVIDGGMTIANAIAQLPIIDGQNENGNWYIGTNDGLPVINYTGAFEPTTVPPANLVTDNIVVIPSAQAAPTYTATSANTSLVTTSITNGVLTLIPASATVTGTTTVTATVKDIGGETASSTFMVNVHALPAVSTSNANAAAATGSQIVFPVTLSAASSSATTFSYSLTAGTAPSTDFQATGSTITIPAGSTTASIPVNVLGDTTGTNETFTLTLSSLSSNAIFSNGSSTLTATGTITPASNSLTATTTALSASSSTVAAGASDTFTATVNGTGATPTGTVTFSDGATTLGTVNLTAGKAVLTTHLTTSGNQDVTATYSGDSTHAASTSPAVSVDVGASTVTTLSASALSVAFGAAETLTADITPSVAGSQVTGTVTFSIGGVTVGNVTVVNNAASLAVNLNSAGTQGVTAVYSGDTLNPSSTSNTLSIVVADPSPLVPAVTRSTLPASAIAGQPFKGSISLAINDSDQIVPETGTVQVNLYATTSGVVSPDSVVIGSTSLKEKIEAGKTKSIAVSIKSLPAGLSAGTYSLVAQVVDPNGVASGLVTGPTVTVAAPTIALSENFTRLSLPPSVVAGSKTSAVAVLRITNNGNILSSGNTSVSLYASVDGTVANGTLIKTVTRRLAIRAGKYLMASLPLGAYPAVADGDYFIVAEVVDPLSQTSSVQSATTINIAAAKIDLAATSVVAPSTATVGRSISVSLSLSNQGNVIASGLLDVAFSLSSSAAGSNPFSLATIAYAIKLEPGKPQILHFKLPIASGSPTGDQYLVATIDPGNAFGETDLLNNVVVSVTPISLAS